MRHVNKREICEEEGVQGNGRRPERVMGDKCTNVITMYHMRVRKGKKNVCKD